MKSENVRWSKVLNVLQFIALLAGIVLMTLGWFNWKAAGLKPTAVGDVASIDAHLRKFFWLHSAGAGVLTIAMWKMPYWHIVTRLLVASGIAWIIASGIRNFLA